MGDRWWSVVAEGVAEKMFTEPRYRRVLSERVHRASSTKRIFIKSPRPALSSRARLGGWKQVARAAG